MIRDNLFPEGMSEEDIENLHKRARLAGAATAGMGLLVAGSNKVRKILKPPRKKLRGYKTLKRAGLGLTALGAASTGLSEYVHYKYRKKLKENKDDSTEKN